MLDSVKKKTLSYSWIQTTNPSSWAGEGMELGGKEGRHVRGVARPRVGRTHGKHLSSVWREALWRLTQLCERAVVHAACWAFRWWWGGHHSVSMAVGRSPLPSSKRSRLQQTLLPASLCRSAHPISTCFVPGSFASHSVQLILSPTEFNTTLLRKMQSYSLLLFNIVRDN